MASREPEDNINLNPEIFSDVSRITDNIEIITQADEQVKNTTNIQSIPGVVASALDQVLEDLGYVIRNWRTDSIFEDASESNETRTKRLEKEAKEKDFAGYLTIKKIMFNVHSNINELDKKIKRLKTVGKKVQRLEIKIYALMHETEEELEFKNDANKKSLLEWLKECYEYKDWEGLNEIKNEAVKKGINISHLFVHLMFLMSKSKEAMKKFQLVKDSLVWVIEVEDSLVVRRIVNVLETALAQLMLMNKSKKGKAVRDEEGSKLYEGFFSESRVDDLLLKLVKEALRLKLVWMHQGLPDSSMLLKNEFPLLKGDIRKFEAEVEAIETELEVGIELENDTLKEVLSEFKAKDDILNIEESDHYKAVTMKINELWDKIEELEVEGKVKELSMVSAYAESLEISNDTEDVIGI